MTSPTSMRFLAEWQHQEAVLMAWPYEGSDWQPWLAAISNSYVELAQAISHTATPLILCQNQQHQQWIEHQLPPHLVNHVRFIQCTYDDTWCRDYGPIAVGQGAPERLLNFRFTGWGEKYTANDDDQVNAFLEKANAWLKPMAHLDFELEGGAIETDGEGTLLTTTACLLDSNRNKGWNKSRVESALQEYLGVSRILWVSEGFLSGDDTDSHIDNLVRFANAHTLVYTSCDEPNDPHYAALKAMAQQVTGFRQTNGQPYHCIPLPIPAPISDENGKRLPASYANFLILNDSVIVPTFLCDTDKKAMENLQHAFPNHRLIAIDGRQLIKQYGGPHCATMQIPKGLLNPAFLHQGETQC